MDIVAQARTRNMPYGHLELIDRLADEIERLKAENKWLYDQIAAQKRTAGAAAVAALEPKP